jgi:hypothetical protein
MPQCTPTFVHRAKCTPQTVDSNEPGSPTWIRTTIHGSKGRCPTVRRSGKKERSNWIQFNAPLLQYARKVEWDSDPSTDGSQSWPVPGPDFKPGVRYFVSLVGSTPTGFRHFY